MIYKFLNLTWRIMNKQLLKNSYPYFLTLTLFFVDILANSLFKMRLIQALLSFLILNSVEQFNKNIFFEITGIKV